MMHIKHRLYAAFHFIGPALLLVALPLEPALGWKIVADFEGYQAGALARGPDAFSHTTDDVIDDSIPPYSGKAVARLDIEANTDGFGSWGGVFDFPVPLGKGDEIWYRVNIRFPAGFDYNAQPFLKFLRIHTPAGHLDWYIRREGKETPFQWIYEGEQLWSPFGSRKHRISFDRWETYEMYLKLDNVSTAKGGQALVRVWKNGELLGEFKNRKTLAQEHTQADYALLFTYWNGENPPSQYLWVDDIVITNERPCQRDVEGHPYIGVNPSNKPASVSTRPQAQ